MRIKAFTLVEVLIVVVVLGILAAIVVPQFSQASNDAKQTALNTNVRVICSQLELYKAQHNGALPALATFASQMTGTTDVTGAVGTGGSYPCGPYLQSIPNNPYTNTNTVGAGGTGTSAWYYNATTGVFRANNGSAKPPPASRPAM